MNNRPSIDWNGFTAKLAAIALGWLKGRRTEIINGKDALDIAKNAAVYVFEKYHLTGPAKTEGELFAIALKAMWHGFLDQVKSKANRTSVPFDDYEKDHAHDECESVEDEVLGKIEDERVMKEYYSLAEGDEKLNEFIYAVTEMNLTKRQEIAELLMVTPQEVTNMQRKLRYRRDRREEKASKLKLVN
jgi:hypothetical protein